MKNLLIALFFLPLIGLSQMNIWYDDCSDASTWVFTNTSTLGFNWYVETDPMLLQLVRL
jgi:hypothetical protein